MVGLGVGVDVGVGVEVAVVVGFLKKLGRVFSGVLETLVGPSSVGFNTLGAFLLALYL